MLVRWAGPFNGSEKDAVISIPSFSGCAGLGTRGKMDMLYYVQGRTEPPTAQHYAIRLIGMLK